MVDVHAINCPILTYLIGIVKPMLIWLSSKYFCIEISPKFINFSCFYFDRATPYYLKLQSLKFTDLLEFKKALFIYQIKTKSLPQQFYHYLNKVSNVYQKSTRALIRDNYYVPFLKTSRLQNSIKYQGPIIWNNLTTNLKKCISIKTFKLKLKTLLLKKYNHQLHNN